MDEFGNQLVGFGGSMMRFAASIKGLDADAVNNAAIAGEGHGGNGGYPAQYRRSRGFLCR